MSGSRVQAAPVPRFEDGWAYYGWRIVTVLAVTQTVGYGVLYYAFAVFLPSMREALRAGTTQITGAFTLALLVSAVAAVPVGWWLDRCGGRALMTAGSVIGTGSILAWAGAHDLLQLYVAFAGIGLASAMVLYEPAFAVVVTWFHQRRAAALLAVTVVAGFASTIFLPLAGRLIGAYGWRTALLVLAAVHAVSTIPLHALIRCPKDLDRRPLNAPAAAGARHDAAQRAVVSRAALRDPVFFLLGVTFVAETAAIAVIGVHLVAYLTELGHTAGFAATISGLLGVLSVSGRLATTAAQRHRAPTTITAAVFGIQAVAALTLPLVGADPFGAAACVVAFGLGFGVGTIARPALLAEVYGTTAYATLSGMLTLPLTVAKAAAPLAAAVLRSATGSYTTVMIAVAAACAVAAAGLLTIGRIRSVAAQPHEGRRKTPTRCRSRPGHLDQPGLSFQQRRERGRRNASDRDD